MPRFIGSLIISNRESDDIMFRKQQAFCMICGQQFLSDYNTMKNGSLCSRECLHEWDWRYTLYVMGKEYRQDIRNQDIDNQSQN